MTAITGLRRILRDAAPWVAAALCLEISIRYLWPLQLEAALADKATSERLAGVVPNESVLRAKTDSLAKDSIRLGSRLALAKSRQIEGPDPAAILASRVVPLLAERGWKLDRVKAQASQGVAELDIGASAPFGQALQGLEDIRMMPFSVKVRKLSLRPGPSGRLAVDLLISVPARGTP